MNADTLAAHRTLFGVTLPKLYAYRQRPFKVWVALSPLTLLLVGLLSVHLLDERLDRK